jgi:release factor glutamine methyltransferase
MSSVDDKRIDIMVSGANELTSIRAYRQYFIAQLTPIFDQMEAESFFYMALEEYRQLKRTDLALNPGLKFNPEEIARWNQLLEGLKQQQPIQYLLGKAHFYGLEFIVSNDVLIPRPETEELVAWVIQDSHAIENLKIVDIGTGSGCIAIALAKNLRQAQVSAIDVSFAALDIASKNAARNDASVNFIPQDILKCEKLTNFDVIVSNPPYVRKLEKAEIRQNVLDHEPHLALFVEDDDALLFYRKIAQLALQSLPDNGKLYFEINQYLGAETVSLLEQIGYREVLLKKDIYGNDRMIRAIK